MRGSLELQNGGLRALEEAWDDFLLEAFSCQVWSFSVLLGRLWVGPGDVDRRPWSTQEVRGSHELQNGGLRALEEAWKRPGGWRLGGGGWRLGTGGWRLEAGRWRLVAGGSNLEAGGNS